MKRYILLSFILLGFGFCYAQSSCIVINEFVVDPKDGPNGDASNTGEFIELYNKCNCAIDIGCFVLCATDNSSGRRGDCITIPAGTSLAAGGLYVIGGYGTNCSGGGVTTCDWPSLTLDRNWHSNATTVWKVASNLFFTTNVGNYIGVIADGGEDLSLFDNTGTFIYGVYADGGAGIGTNNTENIGAIVGCNAKSITIPPTSSHINAGTTPGTAGADGGFRRNCDNTWTHVQKINQTPGVSLACTPVSCALPIELITFEGVVNDQRVDLHWTTSSEINNDYFTVERSDDAYTFSEAGRVKGAGNSNKLLTYEFTDKKPYSSVTYYRLKQTDFNTQFKYSDIIVVQRSTTGSVILSDMYPNPADNGLSFSVIPFKIKNTLFTLTVFNTLGQVIEDQNYTLGSETGVFQFDTSHLPDGLYNLVFNLNSEQIVKRVIVRHN